MNGNAWAGYDRWRMGVDDPHMNPPDPCDDCGCFPDQPEDECECGCHVDDTDWFDETAWEEARNGR